MNISDINTSTHRPDQLKNANVGLAGALGAAQGRTQEEIRTDAPGDRVEISEKARAALADARRSEELTFARNALHSLPEMSEERMTLLKDRISSGFYSRPDVLQKVAQRLFES